MSNNSIARVISVLKRCVEMPDGASFSELRKYCGNLEASQLSRILKPLIEEKMITKNPISGKYLPGNVFISIAGEYFSEKNREEIIRPLIKELSEASEASAAYFKWDGTWIELKIKHDMPNSFHYAGEGSRGHKTNHTFFRVIQAFLPENDLNKVFENSEENLPSLKNAFENIRREHTLAQMENVRDVITRIVAPVFLKDKIIGAAGITVLCAELDEKTKKVYEKQVSNCAKKIMKMFESIETAKGGQL